MTETMLKQNKVQKSYFCQLFNTAEENKKNKERNILNTAKPFDNPARVNDTKKTIKSLQNNRATCQVGILAEFLNEGSDSPQKLFTF